MNSVGTKPLTDFDKMSLLTAIRKRQSGEGLKMKQKLYALAIGATKRPLGSVINQSIGACCLAMSEEEAIGKGVKLSREQWSQEDGWGEHWCSPCLIPDDMIKTVA